MNGPYLATEIRFLVKFIESVSSNSALILAVLNPFSRQF